MNKKNDKIVRFLLIGFACLLVLFLFYVVMVSPNIPEVQVEKEKQVKEYKPENTMACIMAQGWVEDNLVSPSTADFQACRNSNVVYLGEKMYIVNSYVDSQNGFGAMLRTFYTAELFTDGEDSWYLWSLQFD